MIETDWQIEAMDILDWAAQYDGPKFHALLCDPPYELGFMGKDWDRSGIAFKPDTWAALAEHLHPGAFGMAFASARGWHRLAVAIEDAGLRIHPSIFGWSYGSGFPKATRIDAQIEKQRKDDIRPVCRFLRTEMDKRGLKSNDLAHHFGFHPRMVDHWAARDTDSQPTIPTGEQWKLLKHLIGFGDEMDADVKRLNERKGTLGEAWHKREVIGEHAGDAGGFGNYRMEGDSRITIPATPLARAWQGHRYGLQALKPALEPIIVFQKPYQGKPVNCITETGAGALWIDGGRIGAEKRFNAAAGNPTDHPTAAFGAIPNPSGYIGETVTGRWPANFCLVHHPECQRIGTRRVKNKSGKASGPTSSKKIGYSTIGDFTGERGDVPYYADSDGLETITAWDCVPECPVRRLGEQSGERPSGGKNGPGNIAIWGGTDRRQGGNMEKSTGTAARFFHQGDWSYEIAERLAGADPVLYQAKASRKERDAGLKGMPDARNDWDRETSGMSKGAIERAGGRKTEHAPKRNAHPTVKPIALARWLATLLLPPPEYAPRRILIPFSGSGSEGIGAGLVGWDEITMIDNEAEYCQIAEARMIYWLNQTEQLYLMR